MADNIKTILDPTKTVCRITVLGLGGCGTNAINHMVREGLKGPTLIAANTDVDHLMKSAAPNKLQIGAELTEGLGAGGHPSVGKGAAEESMADILKEVGDSHMVFVTAGLGGGTGTGAAPVVVEALTKLKKPPLVVSVVVMPFKHESDRPAKAKPAYEALLASSNSLITISNEMLLETWPDHTLKDCKAKADQVLYRAVSCITDLILNPGEIHLDFADIRSALSAKGLAIMGVGEASGQDRGITAAKMAISCPLMDDRSVTGAKYLLINIVASEDIKASEFKAINEYLVSLVGGEVQVLSGVTYDDSLAESGTLKVTVIATGLSPEDPSKVQPVPRLDDDDDEPITLLVEAEPHLDLGPEPQGVVQAQYPGQPRYQGQPQPAPQGPAYAGPQAPQRFDGQVQTPGQTPTPPPRRTVRLNDVPLDRVPPSTGYNKYEANSIADPANLNPRTTIQRAPAPQQRVPAPPQRALPGQGKRGVDEARSNHVPSYMIDKAN
ncbi:MAG: cell division protein FtsZ [Deltaproteobacteria bacterium]|jgi:cell division protein FtsZ|nr:cell division protein FtsZ [Deltaproteobacteria bacterium]